METSKKPIYKKWWIWLIAVFAILVIYGAATGINEAKEEIDKEEPAEVEAAEQEELTSEEEETSEDDSSWDDVKNKDNIVGKSDKDFTELTDSKPSDVRNDNTGNWRKLTISDSADILDYALSYQKLHMKEEEVHHVINFALNTTTTLIELNDLLYIDIKERVDKEEHDASTLGSGMLLKSYRIFPDGDIEEIKEEGS